MEFLCKPCNPLDRIDKKRETVFLSIKKNIFPSHHSLKSGTLIRVIAAAAPAIFNTSVSATYKTRVCSPLAGGFTLQSPQLQS